MTAQVGPPEVGESERECAKGGRGETDRRNQHRLQIGGSESLQKRRGRVRTAADFLYDDWGHSVRTDGRKEDGLST
jgi:hypothetical protein